MLSIIQIIYIILLVFACVCGGTLMGICTISFIVYIIDRFRAHAVVYQEE